MDDEAGVRSEVRKLVWSGFHDGADRIAEIVGDEIYGGGLDAEELRAKVAEEFASKRAAEATWPAETDCDRLDRVFDQLEAEGIIALQNAGMTQSDGLDDVSQVYAESGGDGKSRYGGYVFYHGQDLERVVAGGDLWLSVGAADGDKAKGVEIGRRVQAALAAAGFAVRWNGDLRTRIAVTGIKWQRRGPGNG
jgi:hypothetical protein